MICRRADGVTSVDPRFPLLRVKLCIGCRTILALELGWEYERRGRAHVNPERVKLWIRGTPTRLEAAVL